jgi:hypothetical protein
MVVGEERHSEVRRKRGEGEREGKGSGRGRKEREREREMGFCNRRYICWLSIHH